MMTDLELQTLIASACKAAGWPIKKTINAHSVTTWIEDIPYMVRPADDDCDSRVLQVACKIDMFFNHDMHKDGHEIVTAFHDSERGHSHSEPIGTDARKAARMAVLRCAAMIGEAME